VYAFQVGSMFGIFRNRITVVDEKEAHGLGINHKLGKEKNLATDYTD